MKKAGLTLVAIMGCLLLYQNSPFSIYLWGPSFEFIFHVFLWPFSIAPYSFYNPGCSGGFFCIPNPLPALLLFAISFAWIYMFGAAAYWVLLRVPSRFRLFSLSAGMAALLVIGYFSQQAYCIHSYSEGIDPFYPHGQTITPQTYGDKGWPQGTGLLSFNFTPFPNDFATSWFLWFNGLRRINSVLAAVPPGQEFAKLCQIKTYPQVDPYTEPISEKDLAGGGLAPYLNPGFCELNPLYCASSTSNVPSE